MRFEEPGALARLETMDDKALDQLTFGVVGLRRDARVDRYNRVESEMAGLPRDAVVGHHFFVEVAPCTNNFMVAQRFLDEPELDEVLPYILTVKMRPTRVKMRMLKSDEAERMYLLIHREG